jgi:hypothetical protein
MPFEQMKPALFSHEMKSAKSVDPLKVINAKTLESLNRKFHFVTKEQCAVDCYLKRKVA